MLGDLRDSNIIDGLVGLRLCDTSKSTMTTDDGAEEILLVQSDERGNRCHCLECT